MGLVVTIMLFILWKIYEKQYYKGTEFGLLKQKSQHYIDDCNET